jgi:deoxyribodipyrimidine photo-lyase
MTQKLTLFWFRQDLRLSDNPGLFQAAQQGPVLPIYILDEEGPGEFKRGGASRWWLHHSLENLSHSLGNKLNLYEGDPIKILPQIIEANKVDAVYWSRCYEPWRLPQDMEMKAHLKSRGIDCQSFNGSLLWEPWHTLKSDGTPYKVYTPFYRNARAQAPSPRRPLPEPDRLTLVQDPHNSTTLKDLNLLPEKRWDKKMDSHWKMGETAAQEKFMEFLEGGLLGYKEGRNYPDKPNVSRLSPHLHFGEISPHQAWYGAQIKGTMTSWTQDVDHFLSELGWREFSYYLLYHFPHLPRKNFQPKFDQFPWQQDDRFLKAWQKGQTGYPIVDAGMREMWQTGYMHNRVRMIVASFLVKNLRLHWLEGEAWFWDCLADADLANNSAGWQWVAGSGADAAPYFRIFNPVTQGEKFDPEGTYTRRFVPELEKVPLKYLFKPWEAPPPLLRAAGVTLGRTYPHPLVDLSLSRNQALAAYKALSQGEDS